MSILRVVGKPDRVFMSRKRYETYRRRAAKNGRTIPAKIHDDVDMMEAILASQSDQTLARIRARFAELDAMSPAERRELARRELPPEVFEKYYGEKD